MNHDREHSAQAVIADFLDRLLADRRAGGIRDLGSYQALYPGFEAEIAAAFARAAGKVEPGPEPAWLTDDVSLEKIEPGQTFAHYEVGPEIGRGGQGVVFLATDTRLGRQVALKVLYGLSLLSSASLGRFQREAALAAKLEHPGICTVYGNGVEGGVPYLAMRYVEGETLARKLARWREDRDRRPPVEAILDIAIPVAETLHAAHEQGVVHRDIKPGNIMVTPGGRPVILDFGLARDLQGLDDSITGTGTRLGTPAYMAPEQVAIEKTEPDRRTDVFSLGVVLFEALTLERPFQERSIAGLRKEVHFPPPPDPRKLDPRIGRDLKVVLQTALAADRRDRFQTAGEFAAELRRIRARTPIRVKPPGPVRRLRRWGRRSPVAAAFTLSLIVTLAAGLTVFAVLYRQAERARRESERQQYYAKITAVSTLLASGQPSEARRLLDSCPPEHIGWEHRYLRHLTDTSRFTLKLAREPVRGLAWLSAGQRLMAVTGDGAVHACALKGPGPGPRKARTFPGPAATAAASPDGRWLAAVHREPGADVIRVWSVPALAPRWKLARKPRTVTRVAVSPDGRHVLFATRPNHVFCWTPGTGAVVPFGGAVPEHGRVIDLGFDRGGRRVALAVWRSLGTGSVVYLLDASSGRVSASLEEEGRSVQALAFSRDGQRLVTAAGSLRDMSVGQIRIWDVNHGRLLAARRTPFGPVRCLAVHPHDDLVLAGGEDGKIRLYDGGLEKTLGTLAGHDAAVTALGLDPTGTSVIAASRAGAVKGWDLRRGAGRLELEGNRLSLRDLAFAPSGTCLACATGDGKLEIWDLAAGRLRSIHEVGILTRVAFTGDGPSVYLWGYATEEPARRLELGDGRSRPIVPAAAGRDTERLVFDPDRGRVLFSRRGRGTVEIVSARDGARILELRGPDRPLVGLAVDRAGRRVAAATGEPRIVIWDLPDPSGRGLEAPAGKVLCLGLSPDGRRVAAGTEDGRVWIRDLEQTGLGPIVVRLEGRVAALDFGPQGRRLAVAARRDVAILDAETGRLLLQLGPLRRYVTALKFAPGGDRLAAGCQYGGIAVWETRAASRSAACGRGAPESERAYALFASLTRELDDPAAVVHRLAGDPRLGHDPAVKLALHLARGRLNQSRPLAGPTRRFVVLDAAGCPDRWYEMALETARQRASPGLAGVNTLCRLGMALYRLGRLPEAEAVLERAVRRYREHGLVRPVTTGHKYLALCRWRSGRREEARRIRPDVAALAAADRPAPPRASWFDAFAWIMARRPGRQQADYRAALAWAKTACRREPSPEFRVTLAAVLCRLGRDRESLEALRSVAGALGGAADRHRAIHAAFSCLGHLRLGHASQARSAFNQLLVLRHTAHLSRSQEILALFAEVKQALGAGR